MTDSSIDGAGRVSPDPRHVLLLLRPDWPGPDRGLGGLDAEALEVELSRHGFKVHRATSAEWAAAALRQWPIGAVLLDLALPHADLYSTYELVHSAEPVMPCLLLDCVGLQPARRQSALGRLDELVRVDATCSAELILLYLRALLLRAYPGQDVAALEPGRRDAEPSRAAKNELVCVFAAKGGAGKTTIACNLAFALAKERGRQVALLDGDLYFGDVDTTLGLTAIREGQRRSLLTVVEAIHLPAGSWTRQSEEALQAFDARLLDDVLERHPSGLRVLPAPPRPEMAESIPPAIFARAVDLCRRAFEYTIVDMCSSYSEPEIQLLDSASKIVVVLKPELSCVRNTTLFMDYATQFGWKDKVLLLLNRADSNRFTQISRAAVEQHLGEPVIPVQSSGMVPRAASEGQSLLEAYPDSEVTASLRGLVDAVDGPVEPEASADRGIKRLLRGRLAIKRPATTAAGS